MLVKLKAKSEMHVTAPLGRNSGNDLIVSYFCFLKTDLGYPSCCVIILPGNANFKICFSDTRLKLFLFLGFNFLCHS